MRDLGISPDELAMLTGVSDRTVYRWRDIKQPPRGEAVVKIADALGIPLAMFRDAFEGKGKLPTEYRDRAAWLKRRPSMATTDAKERHARVLAWFDATPAAVQRVILGEVPAGMEQDYLRHVTEYFTQLLTKGGRKRAG